ncbi:hypothetical protein BpHYR1_046714 [Brachionus plicatilis]|uniref:Uncharacterized protein n=1 Tax=Brachionus plicatilis TaxID=10195 RepID=A0A3M7T8V8_BRAPC|nr:hypothetical protein BpHYR1_046714 [Brachionus plicatilis]
MKTNIQPQKILKLVSRKPFSRIFCSISFSEKFARTFLTVKLNLPFIFVLNAFILFLIVVLKKKSFSVEQFEIVLNDKLSELKRYLELIINIKMPSVTVSKKDNGNENLFRAFEQFI